MAKNKKKMPTQNSCQDEENLGHSYIAGGNGTATLENSLAASSETKQALNIEPNNCTLGH